MYLRIQIKKEYDKPSTLTCTREDSSTTFSKLQANFEIHDIAHFVVEKHLKLKNAFYGLLAQGYQIDDFLIPKQKRPEALQSQNLPPEALFTEHLVNLLTVDYMQSDTKMDIASMLEGILEGQKLPFPEKLKKQKIVLIQKELSALMSKWDKLTAGNYLELILQIE